LIGGADGAGGAEFSPDGTRAVAISFWFQLPDPSVNVDDAPRIFDTRTGRVLHKLNIGLKGYRDGESASFSLDGKLVVTSSEDGVRIWDANSGRRLRFLRTPDALSADFSPNSKLVLTVSGWRVENRIVLVWNVKTGRSSLRAWRSADAVFSPNGKLLATVSKNGVVGIVDAQTYRSLRAVRGSDPGFNRDGTLLLTLDHGTPVIWDVNTGKRVHTLL